MLRFQCYLFFLMLFLTACGSNKDPKIGDDGFPEFSQEELQDMVKNNPQFQNPTQPQQSSAQFIQQMEELLEKNPDDLATNYNLAKLHYQRFSKDSLPEHCKKALPYYSKVLEINPSYEKGHAFYNRMLCYFYMEQWSLALADMDQFVKINQGQTAVNYWSMRAEILYQMGDKEPACADFNMAIEVLERDSLPLMNAVNWAGRCD